MALPKRTKNEIQVIVQEFRARCAEAGFIKDDGGVDLRWVLEHFPILCPGWSFEPVDRDEMRAEYVGLTKPDLRLMQLVNHAYEGVCRGEEEHLFTAAHEIGHVMLHSDLELARSHPVRNTVSISEDIEQEADEFARQLLGFDSPANEHAMREALRLFSRVMSKPIQIRFGAGKKKAHGSP